MRWTREMRLKTVLLALMFAFGTGASAAAQEPDGAKAQRERAAPTSILEKGKQFALCRRLEANLDRFPDFNWGNFCFLPFDPSFPMFSRPKWESLDPKENLGIVREIFLQKKFFRQVMLGHGPQPSEEEREKAWRDGRNHYSRRLADGSSAGATIHEYLEEGVIRLERGRVDMDNDGDGDIVYRFSVWNCNRMAPREGEHRRWSYHFLDRDKSRLQRRFRTMANGPHDVFYHEGRIFVAVGTAKGFLHCRTHHDKVNSPLPESSVRSCIL